MKRVLASAAMLLSLGAVEIASAAPLPADAVPVANAVVTYGDLSIHAEIYRDGAGGVWQNVTPGLNVRCQDSPSVYWIGHDGKRYVYPLEFVFTTRYHQSGRRVLWLDCEELDQYPFGGLMPLRAGTLVKTPLDPKVYVAMADEKLRPLPDEETAIALFGDDWADLVFDFPETFMTHYLIGDPLTAQELPDGLLGQRPAGYPVISLDGVWRSLDPSTANALVFHDADRRYQVKTREMREAIPDLSADELQREGERLTQMSIELYTRMIGNPWRGSQDLDLFPVLYAQLR